MNTVTLKVLSDHLGLTEGTVSRALNNYPDISSKTRERVRIAARELGYRPNSNARRLATGQAECVGYVLSRHGGNLSEPFLGEVLDGLAEALSERNWDLTVAVALSGEDELAVIRRLAQSGRVSGFVLSRTLTKDPRVDLMRVLDLPFVTHGRTAESDDHAWFDVDNEQAFHVAVDHLFNLGHRRIAHIAGPHAFNFARLREIGYRSAMQAHGLDVPADYVQVADMTDAGGEAATARLLALDTPPTGLVCVSDRVALGAMKAARDAGLSIGRDLSIIGYDGLPLGEHANPPLTTMAQPLTQSGRRLGEMLLALVDGADRTTLQELRQADLVRRQSDGPPA